MTSSLESYSNGGYFFLLLRPKESIIVLSSIHMRRKPLLQRKRFLNATFFSTNQMNPKTIRKYTKIYDGS